MNLKDEYDKAFIENLASQLAANSKKFNATAFIKSIINKDWEAKELKERMRHITKRLNEYLPFSYPEQINILSKIVANYGGIKGFVFPDFIQVYGLEDLTTSIKAMELFTQYSTAEFAVRPFIEKYPTETMQQMINWSKNNNHHLRRLASEGTRPKLPWAPPLRAFIKDPTPNLPILENLKNDEAEYVRKSVANHLNDISKSQPDLVIKLANQWYGKTNNTNWVTKHALRTLLKKGNKDALAIFGLADAKNITITNLSLSTKKINIGDFIHFEFELNNQSNKERSIRLEYSIDYVKANGKTSGKVFQISEFEIAANTKRAFKRKQAFKELSTRKHYAGNHKINLIVNGEEKGSIVLQLES